jgi:hypothetical protein
LSLGRPSLLSRKNREFFEKAARKQADSAHRAVMVRSFSWDSRGLHARKRPSCLSR